MAYRNKNLEKAIELLKETSSYLLKFPNKGTGSDKFRTSYELANSINDFVNSLEK